MSDIHIGISGWRYAPWRGDFYPEGLKQRQELAYASRAVSSIEINGSFYALQTPERYAGWYADTPDNFVFSVKAPRYITHVKRLRDVEEPIANFYASGVLELGDKLGATLWQFPPSFKFDPERFGHFLSLLPATVSAARRCAAQATRGEPQPTSKLPAKTRLRHAVEIRHSSFACDEFIALLRKYKVALVIADTAGKWPFLEDVTSDFLYLRLHGDKQLYSSGYSEKALTHWEKRIRSWTSGAQPRDAQRVSKKQPSKRSSRDLFCYFDNDIKVRAPFDARRLLEKLTLTDTLEVTPGEMTEKLA
ncbi:DUF72 domain-containing protein [Halopseudomonas laoshanensis]|uniref:DUF72 domain-containing protein n=1 Tax=Halopseudomonas laoshanensis TaxID=2268758 RepID=A0A7V7GXH6_9GAMM|nr:DUF72 domain-containing protein [Halopseudomonas laoshanensis]KAA0695956.1 DUF72 domain-containing protein [Halopseudomonas laoshanensis]